MRTIAILAVVVALAGLAGCREEIQGPAFDRGTRASTVREQWGRPKSTVTIRSGGLYWDYPAERAPGSYDGSGFGYLYPDRGSGYTLAFVFDPDSSLMGIRNVQTLAMYRFPFTWTTRQVTALSAAKTVGIVLLALLLMRVYFRYGSDRPRKT